MACATFYSGNAIFLPIRTAAWLEAAPSLQPQRQRVTWYNTTNAFQQLNNSGQYYHLIALLDASQ